jgi:hypothetical protein
MTELELLKYQARVSLDLAWARKRRLDATLGTGERAARHQTAERATRLADASPTAKQSVKRILSIIERYRPPRPDRDGRGRGIKVEVPGFEGNFTWNALARKWKEVK